MGKDNHVSLIELRTFEERVYQLPPRMIIDKRYPNETNQAFIALNRQAFEFLGIEARSDQGKLYLKTGAFVGAIPIKMPAAGKGKATTDLVIRPCYGDHCVTGFQDWFAWVVGLAEYARLTLEPEQNITYPLTRINGTKVPRYLLARSVILAFWAVLKEKRWRKFISEEVLIDRPLGNVDWSRYARQYSDPQKRLQFPTRINRITTNHSEFLEALTVFQKAKAVIDERTTPTTIKESVHAALTYCHHVLAVKADQNRIVHSFTILPNDAPEVKTLKRTLNQFLNRQHREKYAWRLNFANVFEKYVQQVIGHVVTISKNNYRIPRSQIGGFDQRVSRLMPQYLEPDIVANLADEKIIFDAKYKSYYLPRSGEIVEEQRQRLRADIHQIIAYTSLESAQVAIILAPTEGQQVIKELVHYGNILVGVIGLPLDYRQASTYVQTIRQYLLSVQRKVLDFSK